MPFTVNFQQQARADITREGNTVNILRVRHAAQDSLTGDDL